MHEGDNLMDGLLNTPSFQTKREYLGVAKCIISEFRSSSHVQVVIVQIVDNSTTLLHTCAKTSAICLNE